nr:hypothetical protein CFP56_27306 [Quercus suber]
MDKTKEPGRNESYPNPVPTPSTTTRHSSLPRSLRCPLPPPYPFLFPHHTHTHFDICLGQKDAIEKGLVSMEYVEMATSQGYLRVTMNITTFALCYSNKWLFSVLYFFRMFIRSNNLQLSKNHQLHPINQAAYKFYVGV